MGSREQQMHGSASTPNLYRQCIRCWSSEKNTACMKEELCEFFSMGQSLPLHTHSPPPQIRYLPMRRTTVDSSSTTGGTICRSANADLGKQIHLATLEYKIRHFQGGGNLQNCFYKILGLKIMWLKWLGCKWNDQNLHLLFLWGGRRPCKLFEGFAVYIQ